MKSLASQQQALVDAIFDLRSGVAIKNIANYLIDTRGIRLKTYQSNAQALAQRALGAAYPVTTALLGHESFEALAHAYWHAHPPVKGDIVQWGETLPDFVRASDQLANEPYLSDVVHVEWAMHVSAALADKTADPTTFQWLMTGDPADLWLVLTPGSGAVRSQWPVASIMTAHLDGAPALADVGRKFGDGVAEDAIVWRMGHQPRVREALKGEADFLTAVLGGCSLGVALLQADELDFNAWLPMAVQTGLLLAVQATGMAPGLPQPKSTLT